VVVERLVRLYGVDLGGLAAWRAQLPLVQKHNHDSGKQTPLDIAKERNAKGEILKSVEQIKKDLSKACDLYHIFISKCAIIC